MPSSRHGQLFNVWKYNFLQQLSTKLPLNATVLTEILKKFISLEIFVREKRFFLKYLKLYKGGNFFLERVLKGVFSRNNLFVQNFSFCG